MPKHAAHGRIVWHDLATSDPDAAKRFYTQILPWKTQPFDDAKDYELWTLNGETIGGVTTIGRTFAAEGMGAHWLPFVCVYDADSTVRHVESLGGRVRTPPKEIPYVGSWAVVADPWGANIGVFEPSDEPPGHEGLANVGEFSWHELATDDYKAAREFYRALFRWEKMTEYDMGEQGIYAMFGQRDQVYGGMFNRPPQITSGWLSYARVADVKPVAAKVKELGGKVLVEPMEVPGGDWIAQCLDPQGAPFALHAK